MIEGLNEERLAASHQRLVLSPYWVVGGPDFEAMRKAVWKTICAPSELVNDNCSV
jgi:hypothetical protein